MDKEEINELWRLSFEEKTVDDLLEQLRLSAQDKKYDIKLVLDELFFKLDKKELGKEEVEEIYRKMREFAEEVEEGQRKEYEEQEGGYVALFDLAVFYEVMADVGKATGSEDYREYLDKALEIYEEVEDIIGSQRIVTVFTIHPQIHHFGTVFDSSERQLESSSSLTDYRERIEEKR